MKVKDSSWPKHCTHQRETFLIFPGESQWSQRPVVFHKTHVLPSGWRSRLCWGDWSDDPDSLGVGRL